MVPEETCRAVFGSLFDKPGFSSKLILDKVRATMGEPPLERMPKEDIESVSEDSEGTEADKTEDDAKSKTKALVQRYLPHKAPADSKLIEKYRDFASLSAKSAASANNKVANFSRFLGFALNEAASPVKMEHR